MSDGKMDSFNAVIKDLLEEYSVEFTKKLGVEMAEIDKDVRKTFLKEYSKKFGEKLRGKMADISRATKEAFIPTTNVAEHGNTQSARDEIKGITK